MKTVDNIVYQTGLGSLGPVLVAMTDKGVCAVLFSAAESTLVADLLKRFPKAKPAENSSLSETLQQVINFIESPNQPMTLPLDMRGSEFQQQVWQALLAIPAGDKRSYSQLAQQIGKPKAYRAVANACARNPIAVLVPCHRVVHKSGNASGYYWGVEIKQALQKREAGQ
ncbi:MAG TPA: methylated-DNA--[protein]-cysteine S-methyltransferase [Methylophaga sp.]|nr:methylated-DNA--[protein]-cysteine S-methyltransferase [Methylophaga sp.]